MCFYLGSIVYRNRVSGPGSIDRSNSSLCISKMGAKRRRRSSSLVLEEVLFDLRLSIALLKNGAVMAMGLYISDHASAKYWGQQLYAISTLSKGRKISQCCSLPFDELNL